MNTSREGAGAPTTTPVESVHTIGLLIHNSTDRRLLSDFLSAAGYAVRADEPSELLRPGARLKDWTEVSLIIVGERAAREHGKELFALKHQTGGFFLPLLIALPPTSDSIPWLKAGFDDVLRLPLRKAELAARLQVYLQLRTQSEELRRLTRQVVLAQEDERKRLSRELHDEIGQALTAVNFNLQAFQQLVTDPIVATHLQDSLNIIEGTLQQVRDLSLDLHPSILDDLGLVAALQWYMERQAERAGLTIELVADPLEFNLPADLKTTCFRIAQEALTNILRHARAQVVQVELRRHTAELELVIRDDGIGFDFPAARQRAARGASVGLLGMQERVLLLKGQLEIKSVRGRGTEIRAHFPLSTVTAPHDPEKPKKRRRGAK